MGFLDDYEPVEDRLRAFWAEHPDGRVDTKILRDDEIIVVRCTLWRDAVANPASTGIAHQRRLDSPPGGNKHAPEWTSPYEVCETSAIGRALANLGYAAKGGRPSREEVAKAEAAADEEPRVDLTPHIMELPVEAQDRLRTWWKEQGPKAPADKLTKEQAREVLQEIAALETVDAGIESLAQTLGAEVTDEVF